MSGGLPSELQPIAPMDATGRPWVSVVLPFFRKLSEFARVLAFNGPYWARAGIEVVVVLDDPGEEIGVLQRMAQWPQIRWKAVVNDVPHAWRPPCRPLNVGLRHSSGQFVLVHSPESVYIGDLPAIALQVALGQPDGIVVGRVGFARFDDLQPSRAALEAAFAERVPQALYLQTFYGSLLGPRSALEAVRGYDEAFNVWGGDDDNIRIRLEMAGYRLVACPTMRLLHLSEETRTGAEQFDPHNDWVKCTPSSTAANTEGAWGFDFSRVAADTSTAFTGCGLASLPANLQFVAETPPAVVIGSRRRCNVCGRMLHHEAALVFCPRCEGVGMQATQTVVPPLTSPLRIIAVMQVRNEARYLEGCLRHLRGHVDGIVALDDGSTDATPEMLRADPLVLELLQNPAVEPHVWNEPDNQQRLLECARRHGAGWILVCDADQRFESLFLDNLRAVVDSLPEGRLVYLSMTLRELWDSPGQYRVDGVWGRKARVVLFRLPREIAFDPALRLHGGWLPQQSKQHGVMFSTYYQLYHLEMIARADRLRRRDFYNRIDPALAFQPEGYAYLGEEGPALRLEPIAEGRGYDPLSLPLDLRDDL